MAVECCDVDRCPFLLDGKCNAANLEINELAEHVDTAPACEAYNDALFNATAPQRAAAGQAYAATKQFEEKGGRGGVC